jgi:hypothetical protein
MIVCDSCLKKGKKTNPRSKRITVSLQAYDANGLSGGNVNIGCGVMNVDLCDRHFAMLCRKLERVFKFKFNGLPMKSGK